MPTGPQGQKRPDDPIACAMHVVRIATGQIEDTKTGPAKADRSRVEKKAEENQRRSLDSRGNSK